MVGTRTAKDGWGERCSVEHVKPSAEAETEYMMAEVGTKYT